MSKKNNNKALIKKRQNYLNKIKKEFDSKGWDLKKVYGKKRTDNGLIKSDKAYAELKSNVRKTRSYYKERGQIKKDLEAYNKKVQKNKRVRQVNKTNDKVNAFQKRLLKLYGKTKSAKIVFQNSYTLGVDLDDSEETIKEKVAQNFINSITDEVIETSRNGVTGYAFKNHSEDKVVKEALDNIKEKMKNDKFAPENSFLLRDYLFGDLIYEKYHGENAEYDSKTHKADDKFWKEISYKLQIRYKQLLEGQKTMDDMEGTMADDIVDIMLRKRR